MIPPRVYEPIQEGVVATIRLVCKACDHGFAVETAGAIKDRQKRCPECGSHEVRQTMGSFLSNGPLSSPTCGAIPTGGHG
jgi:rRNA maturation endonuclease Nob1